MWVKVSFSRPKCLYLFMKFTKENIFLKEIPSILQETQLSSITFIDHINKLSSITFCAPFESSKNLDLLF